MSLGFGLSFACGRARARGRQPCLPHREGLRSSGRTSDGFRFCTRNGSGAFVFRASGRHPNVEILGGGQFLRDLTTQTDGLTVTQPHGSRMLCTFWSSLRGMCCSTRNSQKRAHRWGVAASFPLLLGGHRTTTLRSQTLLAW